MDRARFARTSAMAYRGCKDIGIPSLNGYGEVGMEDVKRRWGYLTFTEFKK